LAEKCIGVREDTGAKCNRSASSGSDFCFMHQSQEGNQKVQHLDDDVYYCPEGGEKLLYDPKRDYHRCKKCRGSLFSGKMISSDYARKISQSSQVEHEEKCCSCLEGSDLSIHGIEAIYIGGSRSTFGDIMALAGRKYEVVRVWLCNNCGSVWVEGTLLQKARVSFRGAEYLEWLFSDGFNVNLRNLNPIEDALVKSAMSDGNLNWFEQQEKWRDIRLGKKAEKERKKAELRLKLCNHVDDSGAQCAAPKSQKSTHDQDYCYKHQPK
jgi:ribosomal protein L37AE/L43A